MRTFARLVSLAATTTLLFSASAALAEDDAGEKLFKKHCAICHKVEEGKNGVGPSLAKIVGRTAGTAPGYAYSTANKNSGITWSEESLLTYLTDPKAMVPGTKMAFAGLKDEAERKALIAYLKTK
jgi:cytochrome c